MPERGRGPGAFLRGLVRGAPAEPPRFAARGGAPGLERGIDAVLLTEARLGSAVCHAVDPTTIAGAPVEVVRRGDAGSALAAGYGMALAGRRVAVLAHGADAIVERLRAMVDRHVPLVLHVIVEEARDIETLAATGAPVAVAVDPEQAADLALVARRLAESALTPVVLALEAADVADAFDTVHLPPPELVREYAGEVDDEIESPTPAQRLLFGSTRRRVPRWFDFARPTAHGQELPASDRAAAALGRDVFFRSTVGPALGEAVEAFRALTGRDCGPLVLDGRGGSRRTILARGAAVPLARTTVDRLAASERAGIGVVGVVWQGSLFEDALGEALGQSEAVVVLDRDPGRSSDWPRRLRALAGGNARRFITATYGELTRAGMLVACRNLLAGDRARTELHLGVTPPSARTGFPRRRALLDRLRREFPGLEPIAAHPAWDAVARDEGARTVALFVASADPPMAAARRLADRLAGPAGLVARGRTREIERGLWEVRLTFGRAPLADPGDDAPIDVLLIGDLAHTIPADPLARMARGGSVVVATTLGAAALAGALPAPWRDGIAGLELRLWRVDRPRDAAEQVERLAEAARELVSGTGGAEESGESVSLDAALARAGMDDPGRLPLAVRRFGDAGESFDNVARFFAELAQPRASEPGTGTVPDPYVAAGAVPGCASSLRDATPGRETIPSIDAARCTGCGICWVSCPDSAIGPLAIGTAALLDAARAGADDEAAAKLGRAHKQLGARIDALLARGEGQSFDRSVALEAFRPLLPKIEPDETNRAQIGAAFDSTLGRLDGLALAVTAPFFLEPHAEKPGSGELLLLAVNPWSCQGCGICAQVCPAEAIERVPQTADRVEHLARAWRTWEDLPDTSGATIARVSRSGAVDPLAAILLSRHCGLSVTGGGAEPGSGERLAVRLVAAVLEYRMQQRMLAELAELEELARRLRVAIDGLLARSVAVDDLDRLHEALRGLEAPAGAAAGRLLERLEALGQESALDVTRAKRLVDLARRIERLRGERATRGAASARYGVVLTRGAAPDWAGRFPLNPFCVPAAVDLAADGPEVAAGLLQSLVEACLGDARLVRRARLWLEPSGDIAARELELESLAFSDLTVDERATLPPILVLAAGARLEPDSHAGLAALLEADLPAKVLLLDERDLRQGSPEALLGGLGSRHAFVAAVSIAHPAHLFESVGAALAHPGPALLHVHAPSPRRHGFDTDATIDRARRAVDCRVHPLLRYVPSRQGVFGSRIDLEGNPAPARDWHVDDDGIAWTPERFAAGEARFQDSTLPSAARGSAQLTVPGPNGRSSALGGMSARASRDCAEAWRTLQELAGVVTPFTDAVRREVEEQVRAEREAELAALRAEYESRIAELAATGLSAHADSLRRRLMQLAGIGTD